jgi:ABC-type glycerol-3-phosphate transport system substrate-binding protein
MRRLLLACASVALLGCGGDSTGPAASAEGTWNLLSVNGHVLPAIVDQIPSQGYTLEIVADQYVLHGDGTYNEAFTTRATQGTQVTTTDDTDAGTWSQQGVQVSITPTSGGTLVTQMNGAGNRIAANIQGFILIFGRQ